MVAAFWLSCALVAYVYIGYPLLLAIWARVKPCPTGATGAVPDRPGISAPDLPGISIVIAARNEGDPMI